MIWRRRRATYVARRFRGAFTAHATKSAESVGAGRRVHDVCAGTRARGQVRRNGRNRPRWAGHVAISAGHVDIELTRSHVTNCAGESEWCSWRQRPPEARCAAPSAPPAPQMLARHVPSSWRAVGLLTRLESRGEMVATARAARPAQHVICPSPSAPLTARCARRDAGSRRGPADNTARRGRARRRVVGPSEVRPRSPLPWPRAASLASRSRHRSDRSPRACGGR